MIRTLGDPVLRMIATPVEDFDDPNLAKLIERMKQIVEERNALGLAAPQLGITKRIIIYRHLPGTHLEVMINPVLMGVSSGTEIEAEGCLSIPGELVMVERALGVGVEYQDETGTAWVLENCLPCARVIQHELDHLDGTLITDYA